MKVNAPSIVRLEDRFYVTSLARLALRTLRQQLSRIWLIGLATALVALAATCGVYLVSLATATPLSHLTRDPASVARVKFYVGLLSNLGVIAWAGSTAICFFGAALLRCSNRSFALFSLASGLVCSILMIDDTFQIHEKFAPKYLHLRESYVYVLYLVAIALYLFYFRRDILRSDYLLLLAALFFFGLSAVLDKLVAFENVETFIEDSLKFAGIVFFLAYFARTSAQLLRMRIED